MASHCSIQPLDYLDYLGYLGHLDYLDYLDYLATLAIWLPGLSEIFAGDEIFSSQGG